MENQTDTLDSMSQHEILRLFDQTQRQRTDAPGLQTTDYTIRWIAGEGEGSGCVVYSRLTEETADAAIAAEIAFYTGIGQPFEWKWYAHDTPADLRERLMAHGFEPDEPETLVCLELANAPHALLAPVAHDVRRVTDPAGMADVAAVQNAVWDEDLSWITEAIAAEMRATPEAIAIYVAYADGTPVSAAWIRFRADDPFASLWGGSTVAAYRGQGFYTALLAVRIQEAIRHGVRFVTVDARETSRPILEKRGFRVLTTTQPFLYHPPGR
jgi:GNAT superfamily N-acetyltransferase